MCAIVVSFFETVKDGTVSFVELREKKPCEIVEYMRLDIEIGILVRRLLKDRGLDEKDLLEVLDVSTGSLSKKLNGKSSFKDEELKAIARFFGTEAWKLFALASGVKPERIEWQEAYDLVTPGLREEILHIVRERGNRYEKTG